MPHGKYLPEGKTNTCLVRNVNREPPRLAHRGQPHTRGPAHRGRCSVWHHLRGTRPESPNSKSFQGSYRASLPLVLRGPPVSFLPGHSTFVASDTQVTFSIFYLWGVALLDRFLSTGLDETCLGRNLAGPGYLPGWEVQRGHP